MCGSGALGFGSTAGSGRVTATPGDDGATVCGVSAGGGAPPVELCGLGTLGHSTIPGASGLDNALLSERGLRYKHLQAPARRPRGDTDNRDA